MLLWDILLLKFLWDGHKAHEAWLSKPASSPLGALIKIPFLLLEFLFRLVILGPFLLVCVCVIWGLAAPRSFTAFTHWLAPVKTHETAATALSPDVDTSAESPTRGRNTNPVSPTPNIDRLERMYGAETRFDYVSDIWGTQLPQLTASDARRIITDRELTDAHYIVTLPRDETTGHAVLVDKQGNSILVIRREPAFIPPQTTPATAVQLQTTTSAQMAHATTEKESTAADEIRSPTPAGLPDDVSNLIATWVSTVKNRDIQAHLSLYAENVDQFYTKHDLTHRDISRELTAMYNRYTEISVLQLSNWSWNQIEPNVVRVTFDKHFEAILAGPIRTNSKRVGDVRSQLVLRHFEEGWKIISESDRKVYSLSG